MRDFCHRRTPEKLWISLKIRFFGEISKEKYLQITQYLLNLCSNFAKYRFLCFVKIRRINVFS